MIRVKTSFEKIEGRADVVGTLLVKTFHLLALFAIGDNLRKGAALNAVQLAELLLE